MTQVLAGAVEEAAERPGLAVLIVDDHPSIRRSICGTLEGANCVAVEADSVLAAEAVLEHERFDLVILDKYLVGEQTGMDLLPRLIERGIRVVMITGEGSINEAMEALSTGAMAYLPKPFFPSDILGLLRKVQDQTNPPDSGTVVTPKSFVERGIVGKSRAMTLVATRLFKIAPTNMSVFITGPTGTGKELVAREVHRQSKRSGKPFVAINCGALTETLLETELFGHAKGGFTGADRERVGLLEDAHGGTIFLDEITETTPAFQVKLLRALQEGKIRRVGSNRYLDIDVRVVAATNKDIEACVESGEFRVDLYHRINQEILVIPSLKDRPEDIEPLAMHFIAREATKLNRTVCCPPDVKAALKKYDWPANVRELENAIIRAVSVCDGLIRISDLPDKIQKAVGYVVEEPEVEPIGRESTAQPEADLPPLEDVLPLEEVAERHVHMVYERVNGNLSRAAEVLRVDRSTLQRKFKLRGTRGAGVSQDGDSEVDE
ncbi:MAG: sigma-54-dependent transcriptional regulator [Pyrinomonadaceae bacterium]